MSNLQALLDRLKAAQRDLITALAKHDMLPPDSMLMKISALENTIAAVEALMDEERPHR